MRKRSRSSQKEEAAVQGVDVAPALGPAVNPYAGEGGCAKMNGCGKADRFARAIAAQNVQQLGHVGGLILFAHAGRIEGDAADVLAGVAAVGLILGLIQLLQCSLVRHHQPGKAGQIGGVLAGGKVFG